ncbi:hypothetical protein [Modestobacter roseus]|uniref:Uncharacterized protein n=1 Tax=Modestobacter roseus TaxID=1181884 RepID=A0A562ITN3_9ACTN|nr:hypothetical protein [Modestobacter roseus]MQA33271.1 hypothetical protein [Modestobacter roseus]TWH74196.1 hypothetical protein JD78_02731 [Modestobacter roseus]
MPSHLPPSRRGALLLCAALFSVLTACTAGAANSGPSEDVEGDGRAPAGSGGAAAAAATPSPPPGAVTDDDAPVATDAPRPSATDVAISYLVWDGAEGEVLASGWVSPVIEDGGTCTLELTRDGETATTTSAAFADATTTSCGQLTVPGAELRAGEWTGVISYRSGTSTGRSPALSVEVTR